MQSFFGTGQEKRESDQVIARALEQKPNHQAEVAPARDFPNWKRKTTSIPVLPCQRSELQKQVDQLVQKRDALRVGQIWRGGSGEVDGQWSSPMPFSNRHDLQGWMSERNCDLRNAMEFGDSVLISKVGALVGQGAAQVETLFRHVPKNGVSKSSIHDGPHD